MQSFPERSKSSADDKQWVAETNRGDANII